MFSFSLPRQNWLRSSPSLYKVGNGDFFFPKRGGGVNHVRRETVHLHPVPNLYLNSLDANVISVIDHVISKPTLNVHCCMFLWPGV